jgi:NAD(P)-dependent dehydrogenase (short-subunit alcohol dehydrogenase family)
MTLDQFSLAGRKALVTGASRGIGQVIRRRRQQRRRIELRGAVPRHAAVGLGEGAAAQPGRDDVDLPGRRGGQVLAIDGGLTVNAA